MPCGPTGSVGLRPILETRSTLAQPLAGTPCGDPAGHPGPNLTSEIRSLPSLATKTS
jgi:hypothetical protein